MGFALVALCGFAAAPQDPPLPLLPPPGVVEVAPEPHRPYPPVAVAAVKGGYTVALNRGTAEMLAGAVEKADEKQLAETLRKMAKDKKDADPDNQTAKTLELVALVVQTQLPGFKKELPKNMGQNGVVITLTGFQDPVVKFRKPRPKLEKAAEIVRGVMPLLPDEAREAVEAMRAVARTKPVFWKVEPRE